MKATTTLSALLLLLTALQASAAEPRPPLLTSPLVPLDTVPTSALVDLEALYTFADQLPQVHRQGQTIRIDVEGFDCGPLAQCSSPIPVELGLLEAGTYTIETWIGGEFFENHQLEVAVGPRLEVAPALPAEGDAARLQLTGDFGPCPNVRLDQLDSHNLRVVIGSGSCSAGFAEAAASSLDLPLPPLPAGAYQVEVLQGGQPGGYFNFEVLPARARLQNGRFELAATWRDAAGNQGQARLVQAPSNDSALFYFFTAGNWELMVKVLDGCSLNNAYWVFAAASTDVEYSVTVKDLLGGQPPFTFGNALGQPAAAITQLNAFPCS